MGEMNFHTVLIHDAQSQIAHIFVLSKHMSFRVANPEL